MTQINKTTMGFYKVTLKVANMRKEQNFTVYPDTNQDEAYLQSGKRFIAVNLKDGKAVINKKNKDYANRYDLMTGIIFDLDTELVQELKEHYSKHRVGTNEVKSGDTTILIY